MHMHMGDSAVFLRHLSALFCQVKILRGLYNFPDAHAILMVTLTAYVLHMGTPILHATHATYIVLPAVPFRKQVHILLCHLCNLCSISKESSSWYPTELLSHTLQWKLQVTSGIKNLKRVKILKMISKFGDLSRGWTKGSLFDSYYTKV